MTLTLTLYHHSELAAYHSASKDATETSYATYLVCGERRPDTMDVDEQDMDNGEDVVETTILLVAESDLDSTLVIFFNDHTVVSMLWVLADARGSFSQIFSVHIYSLSPSPIRVRRCRSVLSHLPDPSIRKQT